MDEPNNILVEVAKDVTDVVEEAVDVVEEAVDVVEEAALNTIQDLKNIGDTKVIVAIAKPGENISMVEVVTWQKVLLVGLGMFSLGVIVWAGVKIYKSKTSEKKEKEVKKVLLGQEEFKKE